MQRLQQVNQWCLQTAGVTLWQWLGAGVAFVAGLWAVSIAVAVLAG